MPPQDQSHGHSYPGLGKAAINFWSGANDQITGSYLSRNCTFPGCFGNTSMVLNNS